MNFTPRYWRTLAFAALTCTGSFASASEPLAGEKSTGSSGFARRLANPEAYGLLVGRTSKPATDSTTAAVEESSPQPNDVAIRNASWNNASLINNDFSNSVAPPPEPTISESCSCLDKQGACDCCPDPLWCHRSGVFADLLYLRPGNIDYVYAQERTGTLPTDSPTGPVGRIGFDPALGYRLGVTHCLSECSSIQASYTWYQTDTQNTINATPGTVLIFLPGDPSIPNVGSSSIQASARSNLRFQQADLDYRSLLYGTDNSALNYFAGVRYANLKQDFSAQEDVGVPVGLNHVATHISFDGFGIGGGLDGMRRSANTGLLIYGRASASFVSGDFKATYRQVTQFGPNSIVGNNLDDFRVLTILQTELGLGWQSQSGRIRVTAGYQFAGWFNSLTTASYILGVQNRQFNNLNETITFDGLVTRVLYQF